MTRPTITAVINTWNEEKNLAECIKTLNFIDELVIVDMESTDETVKIAKRYTNKIYSHKYVGYVEPARNLGLSKATSSWILLIDADERVPKELASALEKITIDNTVDYVRIPRRNIVFGSWLKHSRWWPDYNIRFFKKGSVTWQNSIHSIPITTGQGIDLPTEEKLALTHLHYETIDQFIDRAKRYAKIQLKELKSQKYQFDLEDLINKSTGDFLSRFYFGEGYYDGLHGLSSSYLQSFATALTYLYAWEEEGFPPIPADKFLNSWKKVFNQKAKEFKYWQYTQEIQQTNSKTRRFFLRLKRKFNL